ncbi:MAG: HAD hydrolase-like protein [Hyphomicrobiales bacterium]
MGLAWGHRSHKSGPGGGNTHAIGGPDFDLDGTLVDTAPDLHAATNHVLSTLKRRSISLDEVRAFVGHGARKLIERGCEATGDPVDPRALETPIRNSCSITLAILRRAASPTGLLALLDRCKAAGSAMAVCTNKLESLSIQLLDAWMDSISAPLWPDTIGIAADPRPCIWRPCRASARRQPPH